MQSSYLVGNVARVSLRVGDAAGAAADPGALRLHIKPPGGAVVSHSFGADNVIVRDGLGRYHADIALTAAGTWLWRWETDPPNRGAVEDALSVQASRVL